MDIEMDKVRTLDVYEYANEIVSRLPRITKSKGYVTGTIKVSDVPCDNNSMVAAICFSIPGQDKDGDSFCFMCGAKHREYTIWSECTIVDIKRRIADAATQEQVDDILKQYESMKDNYFEQTTASLADAYSVNLLTHLKNQRQYDIISNGLTNKDYILSHVCPEIMSQNNIKIGDAMGKPFYVTDGVPGMPDLKDVYVTYQVIGDDHGLASRIFDANIKYAGVDPKEMHERAIQNLNTLVLDHLKIDTLREHVMKHMFPFEIPAPIMFAIGEALFQKTQDESTRNISYVGYFDNLCLGASAMLISRTAMLKIARKMGAKEKIRAIPINMSEMLFLNADSDVEMEMALAGQPMDRAKADEMAKGYAEKNPDPTRVVTNRSFEYDVVTGVLS